MRHRIFIAINLPEDIRKELIFYQSRWPELPIKWTKKENLHITLVFLGYLSNEELLEVYKAAKEAALESKPFSVNLNRICYGPPRKIPPRMIWVEGEKSKEFTLLKNNLEKFLIGSDKIRFSSENRSFSPHITLGRIKVWEWRKIEPEERPEIEEEIALDFEVSSVEVMESKLKRGGAEYVILENVNLG